MGHCAKDRTGSVSVSAHYRKSLGVTERKTYLPQDFPDAAVH
jgi:hypothetical protein